MRTETTQQPGGGRCPVIRRLLSPWLRAAAAEARAVAAERDAADAREHNATVRHAAASLLRERDEHIARLEATRCAFCATAARRGTASA
jgi:hypothetical protein